MVNSPKNYAEDLYRNVRELKEQDAKTFITKFVNSMESRGLAALLPSILKELPTAALKVDGAQLVTVEVAHDIKPEIAEKAAKLVSNNHLIEVEVKVKPELLGGIRVRGYDTVYDASLRSKLVALKEKFVRSS